MAAASIALAGLTGCAGAVPPGEGSTPTGVTTEPPPSEWAPASTESAAPDAGPARVQRESTAASTDEFANEFAVVQERLSGPAGIALVPVGGGPQLLAGERTTGWAWSISKVPLALAALRAHDSEATRTNAALALQASDNDAAAALWRGLGGGDAAAEAIEDVLREAGDPTDVPGGPDAGPRLGFGGTTWSLPDSANFTARLPCLPGTKRVIFNMKNASEVQQWGFWRVPEAAVKGGWGPVEGGYLVRQIAVIPTATGEVAASALVYSPTLEQGERDLDAIADWAAAFTEPLGGGCAGEVAEPERRADTGAG